ncbi:C40 family peptidase [Streptomyces bambusae]|uniref:C40 family peptidase n=1 Tax=Streptomyces bambusae TaxID=1550616 RepID=UPI001CFF141F|nr:C40 family peptidase [Streptomyces bambusae]MCB5165095.1 C40 family peptidase [Streptomyces bambusae]
MSRGLLRTAWVAVATAAALVTAVPLPATADPADPGPRTRPDADPGAGPGGTADAGTGTDPGAGRGTEPGTNPGTNPGTDPGTEADAGPTAAAGTGAGTGTGSPADIAALLTRLQGLYQRTEEATEAYNATAAALKARESEEQRLRTDLGRARTALGGERALAGQLAREQYQGATGISRYARMLLSGDPEQALDQRRIAGREARHRAAVLARLTGAEHRAGSLATAARKALDAQQQLAARQQRQRDEVVRQLREVERLLAALTAEQLAALAARERADETQAQQDLVDSGRLGTAGGPGAAVRTPTAAGGAAVGFAAGQLGKPYVWGAEGPESYDCSGLTSRAWAHAGRPIPRTSQEQWAQLPRVPLDRLRPGDLVVYFPKATHVAIYVGDGKVVQAPRPGARVKVSPIAANPLLGAVRPDPLGEPLAAAAYTPPELPEEAAAGDDSGYAAESAPAAADTSAR